MPGSEPTAQVPTSEPTVQVPPTPPVPPPPVTTGFDLPVAPNPGGSFGSEAPPVGTDAKASGFLADPTMRKVAIGVGVVLVLGIGTLIGVLAGGSHSTTTSATVTLPPVTTTRPPTPTTVTTSTLSASTSELAQAQQVESIAQQSATARANLGDAVTTISNCGDIQTAVNTLNSDANARTSLLQTVDSLDATAIPGGPTIVADLQRALQASAASDQSYAAWGSGIISSGGCTGSAPQDNNWSSAQITDPQATAAKNAFVATWNPIATQLGLTTYQANQL